MTGKVIHEFIYEGIIEISLRTDSQIKNPFFRSIRVVLENYTFGVIFRQPEMCLTHQVTSISSVNKSAVSTRTD